MTTRPIDTEDLRRLATAEAPDLVEAISLFLPHARVPRATELPPEAMSLDALRAALAQSARLRKKPQRKVRAQEAWQRYLAQPPEHIAPQLELADLVVGLYDAKTPGARQALIEIARRAPLVWGIWGGLKRVYKRVEVDLDAELFGVLAARFDAAAGQGASGDVSAGTLRYVRRRAARFLRLLGKSLPELYPQFAVEVLRSYPSDVAAWQLYIPGRITRSRSKKWGGWARPRQPGRTFTPPYVDAWERSSDPLMLLLGTCSIDEAAAFAISGLRDVFPDVLRKAEPAWLASLAFRPLQSAHQFLVETLEASPDLHPSKLRSLGLHDAVLALLLSPNQKARTYAIAYARANAADLSNERLLDLAASGIADTAKLALEILTSRKPRELGLTMLGRLLALPATQSWAGEIIATQFEKKELTPDFWAELLLPAPGRTTAHRWAFAHLDKTYEKLELPVSFWIRMIDDPRFELAPPDARAGMLERLARHPIESAPAAWVLDALARPPIAASIADWLGRAKALPKGMDLERIKGLVFDARLRPVAFAVLGNPKLVSPRDVGLGWLLALARRADPALHEWAHRYLLEHMKPEHFAESGKDREAGIERLFQLGTGPKEADAVRAFAHTYLLSHHPVLGPEQAESRSFGIKSSVPREAYTEARLWRALFDTRADVRRFALAIARVELRRWGAQTRVYELGESPAKEVRNLAYDALLSAGDPSADPAFALTPEELDAPEIFSMTESARRSTRDVGMELIRRHYARIGGADRLGWLMQSADRDVRLFAVRLLWEKHRPRAFPWSWAPPSAKIERAGSFTDVEALRDLLRRLLFMIPSGRSMEALERKGARKLPANVAKRRVIEIVRDVGVDDADFAVLVAPVLVEFTGSIAKGEWHACLAALMTLRAAHPSAEILPPQSAGEEAR